MSDPVTALGGARFEGLVTVAERPATGMITLRGNLEDKVISGALADVAGVAMPALRGASTADGSGAEGSGILWMSPDEAMMLCDYAEAESKAQALRAALGDAHALVVNVSDARAVFRLDGPAIRDVLAKLTPADLRASAFPVGELRRTRLAQVAGAFWLRDETTLDLICFRSVAGYMFDLLSTAADPESAVGHLA